MALREECLNCMACFRIQEFCSFIQILLVLAWMVVVAWITS